MLTLLTIAGLAAGLFKGHAAASEKQAAFDDKIEELERSKELLKADYQSNIESFDLSEKHLNQQADSKKEEYSFLSGQVLENRDRTLDQTATIGSQHSEINAQQIATLLVQADQAEGAANQSVATSGFRNTGSARNVVVNTKSQNQSAIDQSRLQAKMSRTQTFSEALNNYTDANQQMESYQRQIQYTEEARLRSEEEINLKRKQNKDSYDLRGGYLAADLDYMNSQDAKDALAWSKAGSVLSGGLDGATSFYSIFK